MPRLILFSGGVESTALVTMADKADVLLTSELPFKTYKAGYDLERCKAIAKIRGHRLVTFRCEMCLDRAKWMHQLNWLLMAANLFAEWLVLQSNTIETLPGSRFSQKPESVASPMMTLRHSFL